MNVLIRNVAFIGSLVSISAGCWMAYAPLGLIVPGCAVLLLCIMSLRVGGGQ